MKIPRRIWKKIALNVGVYLTAFAMLFNIGYPIVYAIALEAGDGEASQEVFEESSFAEASEDKEEPAGDADGEEPAGEESDEGDEPEENSDGDEATFTEATVPEENDSPDDNEDDVVITEEAATTGIPEETNNDESEINDNGLETNDDEEGTNVNGLGMDNEEEEDIQIWRENEDGSFTAKVKEGEEYEYQDSGLKIKFTRIDSGTGEITVEEIELTDEQVAELGALSRTAWDITSNMANGTFEYVLTFPVEENIEIENAEIIYVENKEDLDDEDKIKTVKEEDIKVDEEKKEILAEGLNHFTLFIPVNGAVLSVSGSFNGVTQVTVAPSTLIEVDLTIERSGSNSENDWESSSWRIDNGLWSCVNTSDNTSGSGTDTESFNITAPNSAGTYDVSFRAHRNGSCGDTGVSNIFTLADGIIVTPPVANPVLPESCGLDIALVLDVSGSISSSELTTMKNAFKSFVDALKGTPTQYSVTQFDTTADVLQTFTADTSLVKSKIDSAGGGGYTNWEDGLLKAQSTLPNRPGIFDLVVFASDGNPNRVDNGSFASESQAVAEAVLVANDIKSDGARILALGIGNDLDTVNLIAVSGPVVNASDIADSDVVTSDFADLANDLGIFASATCGGTITAKKLVDGVPATGWEFTINGQQYSTDADGFTPAVEVDPGTYSVAETLKAGHSFVSASCSGATNNGTQGTNNVTGVEVDNSDIVSCIFNNTLNKTDLSITKTDSPDPVNNNGSLTYTLNINNLASVPATDVVVTDTLPTGFTPSNITPSVGSCSDTTAPDIQCELGELAGGTLATITISGTISTSEATITNNASVTTDTPETSTDNNNDSEDTTINQQGTVKIIKNVVNDNGGTKTVGDFGITLKDSENNSVGLNFDGGETSDNTTTYTADALTLESGDYYLSENDVEGYVEGSWYCKNEAGAVVANNPLTLNPGQNITCTITNDDQPAYITVVKNVTNNDGGTAQPNDFDLTLDGTPVLSGVAVPVNPGTYTADETLLPGYTFSGFSGDCDQAGKITVALGESKTCTLSNDDVGPKLKLVKQVTNDNGGNATAGDWTLTAAGAELGFSDAGDSNTFHSVKAGTQYTLSESTLAGYQAGSWICDGGIQAGNKITLSLAQEVTCSITNDDIAPSLTVWKDVINDNGGDATVDDFDISLDGVELIFGPGQILSPSRTQYIANPTVVSNHQYTLTEADLSGYTEGSWRCIDDATNQIIQIPFTLNEGQKVICRVTNDDIAPSITLNKQVINNNGGSAGVNDFGLSVGAAAVVSGQKLSVLANQPYAINEAGLADYDFVSITGDTQCPAVLGGTVTLDEGENITCTITNDDQAPKLHLRKVVNNNFGGTATVADFTLTADGSGDNDLSGTSPVDSNNTLQADTFALSETGPVGYSGGEWVCSGEGTQDGASIALGIGQEATCTITNDDQAAHLKLVKYVTNDNGGKATAEDFTLSVSGPTPISGDGIVESDVNAGTYVLSETTNMTGYEAGQWSCTNGITVNEKNEITLALGQTTVCSITNNDIQPKLTVTKIVNNGPFGDLQASDFDLYVGVTKVISGVQNGFNAGNYVVSETPESGYQGVISGDCDEQGNLALNPGDVKSCTITNTDKLGKIIIEKQTLPDSDQTEFSFSGTGVQAGTTLSDNETAELIVIPGAYSVSETVPAGWDLTDINCGNDANSGPSAAAGNAANINVSPNETVKCVFTNTQRSSIIIKKDSIPDGAANFTFSRDFGANFQLDDDTDPTLQNEITFDNLIPGNYSVTENTYVEWILSDLQCSDPSGDSTVSLENRKASIALGAGETVTCTFANTQRGSVTIIKKTLGGNGTFSFNSDTLPEPGFDITTVDQIGTKNYNNLQPGSYDVSEIVPTGWDLTGLVCNDPDGGSGVDLANKNVSIDLDAGENITCIFTNTQRGTISGTKYEDFDGDINTSGEYGVAEWTIELWKDGVKKSFTTTSSSPMGFYSFTDLEPGDYVVKEISKNGWYSISPESINITLDPGENDINNNFYNTQYATITVYKEVDTDGDGEVDINNSSDWTWNIDDGNDLQTGTTASDIPAGYHTISENQEPGYHVTSFRCNNGQGDIWPDYGAVESQRVEVVSGQILECIFTNTRDTGSVTVNKLIDNDGNGTFESGNVLANELGIEWTLDDGAGNDMGATLSNIPTTVGATKYVINEDLNSQPYHFVGWYLGDGNCGDLDGTTLPAEITVAKDTNTSVTLCNARDMGTIVVDKVTDPAGSTQEFTINLNQGLASAPTLIHPYVLTDQESAESFSVPTGEYWLEEMATGGWDLTNASCVSSSDPTKAFDPRNDRFNLTAGDTVTCTFTNTQRGSITVEKKADPEDTGDEFNIVLKQGDDIYGSALLENGESNKFNNLIPGTYYVYEVYPAGNETKGWYLDSAYCGDQRIEWDTPINLNPGQDLTCTFNNIKSGKIVVEKQVLPDGHPQTFNFSGDLSGTIGDGGQLDKMVEPGTYTVSEMPFSTSGFRLKNITCDGGNSSGDVQTGTATFNIEPGETVKCVFTNEIFGSVTAHKFHDENMNGTQDGDEADLPDWNMTLYLGSDCQEGNSRGADITDSNGNVTFYSIIPGDQYSIKETVKDGWDNVTDVCQNFTITPGEDKIIAFGNIENGNVTAIKYNDLDGDGIWDGNEPSLGDWDITLGSSGGSETKTTDQNGEAKFSDLTPGDYNLSETIKEGWRQTNIYCTENNENASDIDVSNSHAFSVQAGDSVRCFIGNQQLSDVKVCKEDEDKNRLEGWNLQLLGEKMDEVKVKTDGSIVESIDLPAGDYVLVASGTYEYRGGSGLLTDANFSQRLESDGYTGPYFPWINVNDLNTVGALGIMVNDNPTNWSEYLAADNIYGLPIEDFPGGKMNFSIYDNHYADNVGSLKVEIYKGYGGTTGEDGCFILKNVIPGEYQLNETLKYYWENLSGLGTVAVNDPNEEFIVTNEDNTPYCGDGEKNQESEQCDGSDGVASDGSEFCTSQCKLVPVYDGEHKCPEGTVEKFVSGITLDSRNSLAQNLNLLTGNSYLLKASGEYNYTSQSARKADAAYGTTDNFATWRSDIGIWGTNRGVTSILGDLGRGMGVIEWDDDQNINGDHVYSKLIEPENDLEAKFVISDWYGDWYGPYCSGQSCMSDNSGSLKVDLYECVERGKVLVNKFEDLNVNGKRDWGENSEPDLAGWQFNIYDSQDQLVAGPQMTGPNGWTTFKDLMPGDYKVCEVMQEGWSNSNADAYLGNEGEICRDVTVGPGETVSNFRFSNYQLGSIEVTKDTGSVNAPWLNFDFNGDLGDFSLNGGDDPTTNSRTFEELDLGEYEITETGAPGNWDLTNLSCDSDSVVIDKENKKVKVILSVSGQNISCTFTNERRGQVKITKYEDKDGNGQEDGDDQKLEGWQMFLYESDGNEGWNQIQPREVRTNSNGIANYTGLAPGRYLVCEEDREGWSNTEPGDNAIEYDSKICQGVDVEYGDNLPVIFGNRLNPVTISATKIVCQSEEYLPNWGAKKSDGNPITENTAEDYITQINSEAGSKVCWLERDWQFEYGPKNSGYMGDDYIGTADNGKYITFGPTDGSGKAQTEIYDLSNFNGRIEMREVLQDGFLPFTYAGEGNNNSNNVTAEFYCSNDVMNYDNWEWINNPQYGETYHCVAWNVELGDIHGYKWDDVNGNGDYDCEDPCRICQGINDNGCDECGENGNRCEEKLAGWEIFLDENDNGQWDEGEEKTTTSSDPAHYGWYWFEDLLPGEYSVCEVLRSDEGWKQTFPGNYSQPQCHTVMLPDTNPNNYQVRPNFVPNSEPEYNFGNEYRPCNLFISKDTRDWISGPKKIGDKILYQIKVRAMNNFCKNVKVTDLPPETFSYVAGSWGVSSNMRPGFSLGEPTYASPGDWNIGDMQEGEEITLTYQAEIGENTETGIYPDLAWAQGADPAGSGLLALAEESEFETDYKGKIDDTFVGTQIEVENPDVPPTVKVRADRDEVIEEEEVEVKVKGAVYPATGANGLWATLALLGILAGGLMVAVGYLLKKNKGMGKLIGLFLGLIISSVMVSGALAQTGSLISVRLSEPDSKVTSSFDLEFVAMNTAGKEMTVECLKKSPSDGDFVQFDSVDLQAGGDSDVCPVDGTVLTEAGDYDFKVIAKTDDAEKESATVSTFYDGVGPKTPEYIKKDEETSCRNEVEFKTANDGQTVRVEIYRSQHTRDIVANEAAKIKSVDIGPNQKYVFDDDLNSTGCGDNYFYAVRAFDSAGNPSGVRAEEFEVIIEKEVEVEVTEDTIIPTGGAVPGGETGTETGPEGEVAGEETSGEEGKPEIGEGAQTEDETEVLGEQAENGGAAGFLKNWRFWVLIIVLAGLGWWGYRKFAKAKQQ